jgi:nucleoside-diphosphate-sugar epimerase
MVGPFSVQVCDTVRGTERLLEAMAAKGVRRLVLVSSLSVYDFRALDSFQILDETAPLESHPADREPYCRAKLLQEELVWRYSRDHNLGITILRPGFVFGPGKMWSDQVGVRLGRRFWVRFTASGMPVALIYVENCAAAILDCLDAGPSEGNTFNVVDDALPTRRQYVRELRLRATPAPWVIAVPGVALRTIARVVRRSNDLLLRSRLRLPWLLDPARLETQLKPLRFTNERLRTVVGWRPRVSRADALDRCRGHAA